jgi:hypothetical protein
MENQLFVPGEDIVRVWHDVTLVPPLLGQRLRLPIPGQRRMRVKLPDTSIDAAATGTQMKHVCGGHRDTAPI